MKYARECFEHKERAKEFKKLFEELELSCGHMHEEPKITCDEAIMLISYIHYLEGFRKNNRSEF